MRNPFLEFDGFYGQPFTPRRTSTTAEGLFMEPPPPVMPLPHRFETPFAPPAPQEPVERRVAPPVQRTSETAEELYMNPIENTLLFSGFPFLGDIATTGLIPLIMNAFLRKREDKRKSEGTVKKEEEKK